MRTLVSIFWLATVLGLAACLTGAQPPPHKSLGSFVFQMKNRMDGSLHLEGQPYVPRAGDLFLFDDHHQFVTWIYWMVGTGSPLHSGVAIPRSDGSMAILEAGPDLVPKVLLLDIVPRLHSFSGTILVRRLKIPLTPEQSASLTRFAQEQEGKSYAWTRLLLQATPIRARGGLGERCLDQKRLTRSRWLCGELTAAAILASGIIEPKRFLASAMYPRDLCYDTFFDLSPYYQEPILWYPEPKLTWIGNAIRVKNEKGKSLIRP